jgi:hypothetical protein
MPTFRVRATNCSISVIVDARSAEEAKLFGALFLVVHRLVDSLDQGVIATPWYASLEEGEYVPQAFFASLVPALAELMEAAGIRAAGRGSDRQLRATDSREAERSRADGGRSTGQPVGKVSRRLG